MRTEESSLLNTFNQLILEFSAFDMDNVSARLNTKYPDESDKVMISNCMVTRENYLMPSFEILKADNDKIVSATNWKNLVKYIIESSKILRNETITNLFFEFTLLNSFSFLFSQLISISYNRS